MDKPLELQMWDSSADAWDAALETDATRLGLLDHVVEGILLGEQARLGRLRLLDIGCGEGRFCRRMAQLGAQTLGIDPTERLIRLARERHPAGEYRVAGAEGLVLEEKVDAALFYLSLVDIPDMGAAVGAAAEALAPGGAIIAADLCPFATCRPNPWVKDEHGKRLHVAVENYTGERGMEVSWKGITIINYHRSMQVFLGAFLKAGLVLEELLEPEPTPEAQEQFPQLKDELGVPLFFVTVWRKPLQQAAPLPR